MRKYVFDFCYIALTLTTIVAIYFADGNDGEFPLMLASIAFFYSVCVLYFIASTYTDDFYYPKPKYFSIFPVDALSFWKINFLHLVKRKHFFILAITPLTLIFSELNSFGHYVFISVLLYIELVFLLFAGSILFHWMDSKGQSKLFSMMPLCLFVSIFYPAYKFESYWPILFNPLGSFLIAPAVLMSDKVLLYSSIILILVIVSGGCLFFYKHRIKWLM